MENPLTNDDYCKKKYGKTVVIMNKKSVNNVSLEVQPSGTFRHTDHLLKKTTKYKKINKNFKKQKKRIKWIKKSKKND